jgi:hypothetical protein
MPENVETTLNYSTQGGEDIGRLHKAATGLYTCSQKDKEERRGKTKVRG